MNHQQRYWREKQVRAKQSLHRMARKEKFRREVDLPLGESFYIQMDDVVRRLNRATERLANA